MSITLIAALAAQSAGFAQVPNTLASQDVLVVNERGAFIQRAYESDGGRFIHDEMSGAILQVVTSPRWQELDSGLAWMCRDISVGDNGAAVLASKGLNNESYTMYAAGSAAAMSDVSTLGSEDPQVAVADRANVGAAHVVVDTDPGPDFQFEGTVSVFNTTGDGTPDWQYTFPLTLNYFGGGVAVSDDGQTIVAWKADPISETLLIESFDRNGNTISSGSLNSNFNGTLFFHARQARLSDDGSRAYFFVGVDAFIYDTATGTVEFVHNIGASFDSHALSGDGSTFAYGNFGFYRVFRETSPGNWSQIDTDFFAGGTYVGHVALNQDGSRLAYQIQRYTPAYDHIELGAVDVDTGVERFNVSYDAPGTTYQLVTAGVSMDDAGDYIAGASWGDSSSATPEAFVYDADGNVTVELDLPGSAFDVDIDADGDVAAWGTKGVHANEFGNGGAVTVSDGFEQELHIEGVPEVGGGLTIQVADTGDSVRIAVCDALGATSIPIGITQVDLGTLLQVIGPVAIPPGGLTLPVAVPNLPILADRDVHVQAAIDDGGVQHLTNKVSLRIRP